MGVWALTQGDLDQVYGVLMGGVCMGTDPGGTWIGYLVCEYYSELKKRFFLFWGSVPGGPGPVGV